MFFDQWDDIVRVLIVGALAYAGIVLLLRISGKRTLSKLNAFDFIVTVALGSTLATVLLSNTVSLAEGLIALGLLIFLQFVITRASVASRRFSSWVKSEPVFVLKDGHYREAALKRERVTREEVLAALRSAGVLDRTDAAAVVLETDGSLSVMKKQDVAAVRSTLENVLDLG